MDIRKFYDQIPRTTPLSCGYSDLSSAFFDTLMHKPLPVGAIIWDQNSVGHLGLLLVRYLAQEPERLQEAGGTTILSVRRSCPTSFIGEQYMTFDDILEYLDMVFQLRGRQEMYREIEVVMSRMTDDLAKRDYPRKEFLEQRDGPDMICGGTIYVMPRSERHSADSAKIFWRFSSSWLEKLASPEENLVDLLYDACRCDILPGIRVNLLFDNDPARRQLTGNLATFLFTEAKRHLGKAFDFDSSRAIRDAVGHCPSSLADVVKDKLSWFLKAPLGTLELKSAMLDEAIAFSSAMAQRNELSQKASPAPSF